MSQTARCPFCKKTIATKNGVFVAHAAARGYGIGRKINHCKGFGKTPTGYSTVTTRDEEMRWVLEILWEQGHRAKRVDTLYLKREDEAARIASNFK